MLKCDNFFFLQYTSQHDIQMDLNLSIFKPNLYIYKTTCNTYNLEKI